MLANTSLCRNAVVKNPRKNLSAGTVRSARADARLMLNSNAKATAGISPAGSACASEPPIVPQLRT